MTASAVSLEAVTLCFEVYHVHLCVALQLCACVTKLHSSSSDVALLF